MVITELIKEQILQSTVMFAAGLALGMLYQLWSIIKCEAEKRLNQEIKKRRQKAGKKDKKRKRKSPQADTGKKYSGKIEAARCISAIAELVFWICAAFVVSEFLYYASYGDLSFHNFLALGAGVWLWRRAFYDIVY